MQDLLMHCNCHTVKWLEITGAKYSSTVSKVMQTATQTYIMYPDATRPIYFLSDREDSQAYDLKWQKLQLMHLCRFVDVSRPT